MPQNPLAATVALKGTVQASLKVDNDGNLLVASQGAVDASTALNITAAAVVKATKGTLRKVIVIAPGTTSGDFTLNDSATVGGASAANTVWTRAFGDVKAGDIFDLDVPCANGIVVSAVPGAGAPVLAVVYE